MKGVRQPLLDMLASIGRIEQFSAKGEEIFRHSRENQDAIIRNFEVLGEAVERLPAKVREDAGDIPWTSIAGFRDVLVHQYDKVDLDVVWQIIRVQLPALKQQLQALLEKLPAP